MTEPAERTFVVGGGSALDVEPDSVKCGGAIFTEVEAIDGVLEVELGGQAVWVRLHASFRRLQRIGPVGKKSVDSDSSCSFL